MFTIILSACVLTALTVAVHTWGIAVLLRRIGRLETLTTIGTWGITLMLLRMISWLLLIHMLSISIWALFYWWSVDLPDAETAFYFSGVTYTTIGYGDVVAVRPWRMLAPLEGMLGILMSGLSAGLVFAVLTSIYQSLYAKRSQN